jgi:hypothetical protein
VWWCAAGAAVWTPAPNNQAKTFGQTKSSRTRRRGEVWISRSDLRRVSDVLQHIAAQRFLLSFKREDRSIELVLQLHRAAGAGAGTEHRRFAGGGLHAAGRALNVRLCARRSGARSGRTGRSGGGRRLRAGCSPRFWWRDGGRRRGESSGRGSC